MRKIIFLPTLLTVFGIIFIFLANTTAQNSNNKNAYTVSHGVVGSGGVMGADNGHHTLSATAGEIIVGDAINDPYFLFVGYWQPEIELPPTDIQTAQMPELPLSFKVLQNYPNPFNPQTSIQYQLPEQGHVTIEIFNVMGQRIRQLQAKIERPGYKHTLWNGRDDEGNLVDSGIYLFRVTVSNIGGQDGMSFQETKKMLLVK